MIKYTMLALAWAGLSWPIYHYLGPVPVCLYGLGSFLVLVIWVATRKK